MRLTLVRYCADGVFKTHLYKFAKNADSSSTMNWPSSGREGVSSKTAVIQGVLMMKWRHTVKSKGFRSLLSTMKLILCLLALMTLASSRFGYKEPSMSERCSRTMKNFFLTTCAKELEDSQLKTLQQKNFFSKLISLLHECCKHVGNSSWCTIAAERERRSSVQECFEPGSRRRSRWNPCIILFCLLSAAIYLFHHRAHYLPDRNKQVVINEIHYDAPPSGSTKGPGLTAKTYPVTELPLCVRKRTYSKFEIKMKSVSLVEENVYPLVAKGGSFHPPDCKARFKVGIVVPYRSRAYNLGTFLYNIHPFLMRQKLNYQLFVIEQHGDVDLFNKGRLLNAGFNEMMKFNTFNCVVFHDLDLLPMNDNIAYNCPTLPRHMCSRVNDTELKRFYPSYTFKNLFGGVVSMTREQFERANGYSNLYFGWGAEDNDMFWRLRAAGYPIVRYNSSIGVYLMLPHTREQANPYRHHLLSSAVERYKIDGLSNSEYYVMSTQFLPLFTRIIVDINPRGDNVTDLNIKWSKNKYH